MTTYQQRCELCGGIGSSANWLSRSLCRNCNGRGVVTVEMPEAKSKPVVIPEKGQEMFSNLNELQTKINDVYGEDWLDADAIFVTPDGKQYHISQCTITGTVEDADSEQVDVLQCHLVEMPK